MKDGRIRLDSVSPEELAELMRKAGFAGCTEAVIRGHAANGFQLNGDGTADVFDYAAFLLGKRMKEAPFRTPPTKPFDPASVTPDELAGWLTMYSHYGYDVSAVTIRRLARQFGAKVSGAGGKGVNFLKLVAFVAGRTPSSTAQERYEAYKEGIARLHREQSAAGREIGELPPVGDAAVKEACRFDFRLFCETYFAETFTLEWSQDHIRCISKIETVVLEGGQFAMAMPRGTGKTSLCEVAAVWGMAYGHRRFVVLVGATESAANEMLDSVKMEIETNSMLHRDFPEMCYPILCLDGIANRCAGQTYRAVRTRITWTGDELVLPTIAGADSSGAMLRVAGITGRIRGMKGKTADGSAIRPQLVIIDDPQTRESARSLEQTKNRMKVILGDILGLAGPGQRISCMMPCTVIEPGDLADTFLDTSKHPEWNGERAKLLYKFPDHMELWDEYAKTAAESGMRAATDFYLAHRDEMDSGAVAGWPARYSADEVSAVQNAMNLYYRDPASFASEYQNEALREAVREVDALSADGIARKLNGVPMHEVPLGCDRLTMFVDVQKALLFYCVCAWADDFTGAVVDYGAWPKQSMHRFTLATARPTMQSEHPHKSLEAQIYSCLTELLEAKAKEDYMRGDGLEMRISRIGVDANWGQSTDVVYKVCSLDGLKGLAMPMNGHYIGAASKPMSEYRKGNGAKMGFNWYMPSPDARRIRHVVFDTNFWKTFVHTRLAVDVGERGCLSLYGRSPVEHELFAEHLTAEYRVRTSGRGREVDEWRMRPERNDNHWLDCLVGCAVLASMEGCRLDEQTPAVRRLEPIRLSEARSPSGTGLEQRRGKEPIRLSELQRRG